MSWQGFVSLFRVAWLLNISLSLLGIMAELAKEANNIKLKIPAQHEIRVKFMFSGSIQFQF